MIAALSKLIDIKDESAVKKYFNGFFQNDRKTHAELHTFFTEEFRKLRLQF